MRWGKRLIYVRGATFLWFQSPMTLNPVLKKKCNWDPRKAERRASVHSVGSLLQPGPAEHQVN